MDTLIKVDVKGEATKQDVIHNRWHPDIPMVAYVKPGSEFRVECVVAALFHVHRVHGYRDLAGARSRDRETLNPAT